MIKTKEELMDAIKEVIGDSEDDKALSLLEDVSDTLEDFKTKTSDATDWKTKYEENDKEWRKKYRDRFFNGSKDGEDDKLDPVKTGEDDKPNPAETITFKDLFTEKE